VSLVWSWFGFTTPRAPEKRRRLPRITSEQASENSGWIFCWVGLSGPTPTSRDPIWTAEAPWRPRQVAGPAWLQDSLDVGGKLTRPCGGSMGFQRLGCHKGDNAKGGKCRLRRVTSMEIE
jgi:hypothetical protein